MAHQDHGRKSLLWAHAHDLRDVLQWLLKGVTFNGIALRGDCTWTPQCLVCAALLWAWSDEITLVERFSTARKIIMDCFGDQAQPAGSYQAFIKLLGKWTEPLRALLAPAFRQRMREKLSRVWKVAGWIVFAADGSRADVPRTRKNEERYSPKSKLSREAQKKRRRRSKRRRSKQEANQRKANIPRIWMTVLWHVGSGLPWDWRTGPSDSSERAHVQEMLPTIPAGSLLTADAGFVGYEFWKAILDAGHQFLVRMGSNVTLLKKLGYARERDGRVYLWPNRAAKKHLPPLVLRLIVVDGGKHPVYLVTSILDPRIVGCAGRGSLRPALGHRGFLSPLQADLRSSQAPQPESGQRDGRVALDVVGNVGDGPAFAPPSRGTRNCTTAYQLCRSMASLPQADEGIQRLSWSRRKAEGSAGPRHHRSVHKEK